MSRTDFGVEPKRGDRKIIKNVRNPIGFELAHWYGYEADKGYDYLHSDLKVIQDHKNQHILDDKGRKNNEGASNKAPCLLKKKK